MEDGVLLFVSMNRIEDGGAASIAEALRQPSCCLRKIDLRGNQVTIERTGNMQALTSYVV